MAVAAIALVTPADAASRSRRSSASKKAAKSRSAAAKTAAAAAATGAAKTTTMTVTATTATAAMVTPKSATAATAPAVGRKPGIPGKPSVRADRAATMRAPATTSTMTVTTATASATTISVVVRRKASHADAATSSAPRGTGKVFLYAEAGSNLRRFGSLTSVTLTLDRMKKAGMESLVLEAKPVHGHVIYPSKVAPRLGEWDGFRPDPAFDPVRTAVVEGRKRGIRVFLAANVFTEGVIHRADNSTTLGLLFEGKEEWEAWNYALSGAPAVPGTTETARLAPMHEFRRTLAAYVSPFHPDARAHQIRIVKELAAYRPDGIVVDRVRFSGIESDFSPSARKAFEKHLGKPVPNWPTDILTWSHGADGLPKYTPGPLFDEWLFFRSKAIRDFLNEVAAAVHSVDPAIVIEDFTGSAYSSRGWND